MPEQVLEHNFDSTQDDFTPLSTCHGQEERAVELGGKLLSDIVWRRLPGFGLDAMQAPSFLQLQSLERGLGFRVEGRGFRVWCCRCARCHARSPRAPATPRA